MPDHRLDHRVDLRSDPRRSRRGAPAHTQDVPDPPRDRGGRAYLRAAALVLVLISIAAIPPAAGTTETQSQADPIAILDRPGPATSFSHPTGVAIDTTGRLLIIADTGNHRIRIFDLDGYPISSFRHMVDGPKGPRPGEPQALAVDRKGFLYVVDALANYVDVMDLLGNSVGRLVPGAMIAETPGPAEIDGTAQTFDLVPTALTLDAEDHLLLAVSGKGSQIWGLDENRTVRWVLTGDEDGEAPFGSITDLFVDGGGRLFVTDGSGTPCVRVYEADRRPALAFGVHDAGDENFSLPASVVATRDRRIWVLDTIRQTVKVFDAQGGYLGMFGGLGRGRGDMIYPARLATDGAERLYVLERVGGRLTTFRLNDLAERVNP